MGEELTSLRAELAKVKEERDMYRSDAIQRLKERDEWKAKALLGNLDGIDGVIAMTKERDQALAKLKECEEAYAQTAQHKWEIPNIKDQ